jgi:excisionase family DNA binding protein
MKYLSVGEAAERLGVTVDVVRSLVERGELKAMRTGGGHRRILEDDVERRATSRQATRSRPRANRTPGSRRRVGPQGARGPQRVEPPRDQNSEEDTPSLDELEGAAELEAAKERAAAEASAREEAAEAERQRLEGLKAYGRDRARWAFLPTEWRAEVVEELEGFVTSKRLPPSLPSPEAQEIVRARVDTLAEQYRAAERKRLEKEREADDQRRRQEDDERRIKALIAHGSNYARGETSRDWDTSEADRARREVDRALQDEVGAEWTEAHVRDLVDDVLDQWDDDEEDDDDDEEGPDEDHEVDDESW